MQTTFPAMLDKQMNADAPAKARRRRRLTPQDETAPKPLSSNNIAFRLDEAPLAALRELAELNNLNVNQLARSFTISMLCHGANSENMIRGLEMVLAELIEFQKSLALAVHVLMITAGQVPPAEAQQWVDANLKPACFRSPNPSKATPESTTT
jgi:hypothetical protein